MDLTWCSRSFRSGEASQVQLLWPELQAAQFAGGAQGTLPQLSAERQYGGCRAGHESPWWVETAFWGLLDLEHLLRVFFHLFFFLPFSFASLPSSDCLCSDRQEEKRWAKILILSNVTAENLLVFYFCVCFFKSAFHFLACVNMQAWK